jgi:hypothetical protein
MLFDEKFSDEDWNDFYNYGFGYVQEYLAKGLVQSDNNQYEIKVIKATVEGVDGSGAFTEWFDGWIKNDRLKKGLNKGDGISLDDLWSSFVKDNLLETSEAGGSWDKKRFDQAVWDFTDRMRGYQYNGHLSKKGSTKSSRRMQKGSAGNENLTFVSPPISIMSGYNRRTILNLQSLYQMTTMTMMMICRSLRRRLTKSMVEKM